MEITVYHGSEYIIREPQYGKGKLHNDYGRGFYLTEDKELAGEWAVDLERNGYVNAYKLPMDQLHILDLLSDNYCPLHWLEILLENRIFDLRTPIAVEAAAYLKQHFSLNTENYDLIRGYRADDSYFTFAKDFLNNTISYRQLTEAMHYGKLGSQIMLKSEKAFNIIRYQRSELVLADEWYIRKQRRDLAARKDYYNLDKNRYQKGDVYMMRILDEEMKADDVRLR